METTPTTSKFQCFITPITLFPTDEYLDPNQRTFQTAMKMHLTAIAIPELEKKNAYYAEALKHYLEILKKNLAPSMQVNVSLQMSRIFLFQSRFRENSDLRTRDLDKADAAFQIAVQNLKQLPPGPLYLEMNEHLIAKLLHRAKFATTQENQQQFLETALKIYEHSKESLQHLPLKIAVSIQLRYAECLSFMGTLQKTYETQQLYFKRAEETAKEGCKAIEKSGVRLSAKCQSTIESLNEKTLLAHLKVGLYCTRALALHNSGLLESNEDAKMEDFTLSDFDLVLAKSHAPTTPNPNFINTTILEELKRRIAIAEESSSEEEAEETTDAENSPEEFSEEEIEEADETRKRKSPEELSEEEAEDVRTSDAEDLMSDGHFESAINHFYKIPRKEPSQELLSRSC